MNEIHQLTILGDDLIERSVSITSAYREKVEIYKAKIDLNTTSSMQYGIVGQNKLGDFTEAVLKQMRSRNITGIDETLSLLVNELKAFDKAISKWSLRKLFEGNKKRIIRINSEYQKIESTISKIELKLEQQYQTLSVDLKLLEKMFDQNKECFQDLSFYIYAGESKLKELKEEILPNLKLESNNSKSKHQVQIMEEQTLRLEKRLHNLKLSKIVSMQLASQIRLIQSNNTSLLDKLHSCIVNTLPLWRNQMILSLNVANSQQVLEAQNTISKIVNKVLRRNSKTLRRSSTQIARENERDIVNLYTLQRINGDLLTTVYDVLNIQQQSRRIRTTAESALINTEKELNLLTTSLENNSDL